MLTNVREVNYLKDMKYDKQRLIEFYQKKPKHDGAVAVLELEIMRIDKRLLSLQAVL